MTSGLRPETMEPILHGRLGRPYLYLGECPSTQDILRGSTFPEGAVALTEHQTAGRGRSGRRWDDAPGTALLLSVLLRPPETSPPLPQISLVAALALAEAVTAAAGVDAQVKWPNDVLVARRKVAGILLEAVEREVVCGIGVNVNQTGAELPHDARTAPTSLRVLTGAEHDRGALLAELLARLEDRYERWLEAGLGALLPELQRRDALRGRALRVGEVHGTGAGVATDGRLVIATPAGEQMLVESGEVAVVS